ncbi:transcription factor GTE7 [Lolium perenne]|uniref:transcription factor GTE7 n=1 Tax=Lolium perenne TaxID=4522 RepID=UPI0021F6856D|nr:transcription factor GTE2-like [Lolium perenne]
MTSAVLAGRNEAHHHHHHHWADARVPRMPKPSNPNHRPTPNPNHHRTSSPPPPPPRRPAPPPAASPSGHVLIRPSCLSRREAREVRARLTRELGRVRALLSHIDTWEDQRPPPHPHPHPHPPPHLRDAMLARCAQILTKLRKQRNSVWFNRPVDVEKFKLYDYHAVIRNPMDLGTVKSALAAGAYASHEAFAEDVRLTFANALRYNPVGHEVHRSAGNLLANFEALYGEAVSWFDEERERAESAMPLDFSPPQPQQLIPVPVQAPPVPLISQEPLRMGVVGKRPKPKARDPNKRDMTEEEMHRLRVEIESLPEEKMVNILQIVQKRSTDPALMGDVVELDFEEMDVETLWELDRFVVNLKKVLKKGRQNGGAAMAPLLPAEDDMVMVNVDSPSVVEIGDSETDAPHKRSSEAEMIDEYVDIGDEMPAANYQSVEIEKDAQVASSSSGSDSGSSSSSDSGSRSSGGFDSDGDDARSPD